MIRRMLFSAGAAALLLAALPARSQQAPEDLIRTMSNGVIDALKADKAIQAGDITRIVALVDSKVMPQVDFESMTRSAVGRHWRAASAEQRIRLQQEFKILLVHSYAGALTQVKNQTVEIKPPTRKLSATEVEVRTVVVGGSEPLRLDYRLKDEAQGWKIIDVNVLGVWLVSQYQQTFNQEINAGGIDGLIAKLVAHNKS